MKFSFRKRINFLFAFITVGIIAAAIGTYKNYQSIQAADTKEQQTREVIFELSQLLSLTQEIVISNNQYLITDDSIYLQPIAKADTIISADISELYGQYKDNPAWKIKIDSLKHLIDKRINVSRNLQLSDHQEIDFKLRLKKNLIAILNLDEIKNLVQTIQNEENHLLEEQKQGILKNVIAYNYSFFIFVANILFLLIIVLYEIRHNSKSIKQREVKLQKYIRELAYYKYALDESSIVSVTDKNGLIIDANEKFCTISKYSREELIGKNHNIVNSGFHSKEIIAELWTTIQSGKVWRKEMKSTAKDGTFYWTDTTIVPFLDEAGKPFLYTAIRRDISRRKENEAILSTIENALRKSEINLRAIFDNTNTGFLLLDSDLNIVSFNNKAAILAKVWLGASLEEKQNFSNLFDPDKRQSMASQYNDVVNGREVSFEFDFIDANNDVIWFSIDVKPVLDSNGMISGMCLAINDITERKFTENDLRNSNTEVKKANAELDRFVYSISHELRAPIASILGLYSIINQKQLDASNKDIVNLMHRSILKMDNTIMDVLHYSRNARFEIINEKIDVRTLIEDAFENYKHLVPNLKFDKKIKIQLNKTFYNDLSRFKVIVNNLVSNSLKYAKKDYPLSFIHCNIIVDDEKLIFVMEDNGIGIKSEHLSKMFGMFYRATTSASGTGLGLYIAKECVEKLNGTIAVESEFGKGTKFTIVIPNIKQYLS